MSLLCKSIQLDGWMDVDLHNLPFKVGQYAESKSFLKGFRSAWFRSKIQNISCRRGKPGFSLEFIDFPEEKISWTKLYQTREEQRGPQNESKMELMVRPSFPLFYCESQRPDSYPECDVIAIVDDDWKVGDLVDWWKDDCFWSGRIIMLLGNDKVKISLPEPPVGEGKSYEAFCKDLRPSLDWSPEHGWTVPISRDYGSFQYCARLVQPLNQDIVEINQNLKENTTETDAGAINLKPEDTGEGMPSCSYESSCPQDVIKDLEGVPTKLPARMDRYALVDSHDSHTGGSKYSVRRSNTIDSSIMELEELANKIRWLKGILEFGFHQSSAMKPLWKFIENRGSQKER